MIKTIKVTKYADVVVELIAKTAIMPGHLLQFENDGKVGIHTEEKGSAFPFIAVEDELQGKGINDAYVVGDRVIVWIPGRGDIINSILANGSNIVPGDFLCSRGDGTLSKFEPIPSESASANCIVGIALEAIDISGATGESSTRLQVRMI